MKGRFARPVWGVTVITAILSCSVIFKMSAEPDRDSSWLGAPGIWETPVFTPIPGKLRSRADPQNQGLAADTQQARQQQHGDASETITIMCTGACGAGKSNLLSAIFSSPFASSGRRFARTRQITEQIIPINADGRPVNLRLIDTPGFDIRPGDRERAFDAVQEYLENRFRNTWSERNKHGRQGGKHHGAGVDAILYTFRPNRIDPEDLEYLQVLQRYGAIVPVISKADALTSGDLELFRHRLAQTLQNSGIETFCAPLATVAPQFQVAPAQQGSRPGAGVSNSQLALLRSLLLNDLQRLRQIAWWRYEDFARKRLCKEPQPARRNPPPLGVTRVEGGKTTEFGGGKYANADRTRKVLINCLRVGLAGFLLLRWRSRSLSNLDDDDVAPSPPSHLKQVPTPPETELSFRSSTRTPDTAPTGVAKRIIQEKAIATTPPPTKAPTLAPTPAPKSEEDDNESKGIMANNPWLWVFPAGFGVYMGPRVANDVKWFLRGIFDDIPPT